MHYHCNKIFLINQKHIRNSAAEFRDSAFYSRQTIPTVGHNNFNANARFTVSKNFMKLTGSFYRAEPFAKEESLELALAISMMSLLKL